MAVKNKRVAVKNKRVAVKNKRVAVKQACSSKNKRVAMQDIMVDLARSRAEEESKALYWGSEPSPNSGFGWEKMDAYEWCYTVHN